MAQLYYTQDHEWLEVDGDTAVVGITEHACEQLGELVFVELPDTGSTYKSGDSVGVVESIKAASDIYMPLDGEITEINDAVVEDATALSTAPESTGWLWKMKISNADQLQELMDKAAYQALIS